MQFENKKTSNSQQNTTKIIWGGFAVVSLAIYFIFSSHDFSFILTLAGLIQCFGFGMVLLSIKRTGDVTGISWNTFSCCGLALAGRLISILTFEGYLPVDATGDTVYKLFEILSLVFCILILYQMKQSQNRIGSMESLKWYYLAPPTFVGAILIHPGLNYFSPLDILWTFGLYLECFALLPQILLFQKCDDIEDHTSNFVATQVLSKFFSFIFWCTSFGELNENNNEGSYSIAPTYSGFFVIGVQLVQIVLTCDFLYLYFKSWKTGIPIARLPQ